MMCVLVLTTMAAKLWRTKHTVTTLEGTKCRQEQDLEIPRHEWFSLT